jgi:hypothetical protein
MDKLTKKAKAIPRIAQQEKYVMHSVQPTTAAPRTDISIEKRKALKEKKEKKLKNSDIFEVKKKAEKK